jgi:hypothetical protein
VSDILSPIDAQKNTSYRLMLAVVIFLGALIVIALGVLAVGLVLRFSGRGPAREANIGRAVALPPGSKIVEMQSLPNRLILRVSTADGEEVDIVDAGDGHLIARIKAAR